MKELKLLLLEKGDSQKNLVDKANFNFAQVLSFEGGPYGKIGPEGRTGNPGSKGPNGSFGPQGKRGNIWTVLTTPPANPLNGDYWMNPNSNNEIRIYNSSTGIWDLYSVNINGLDIFREFGPLQTQSGASSKNGYFISLPYPDLDTLVLSDSYLTGGSSIANPQYTKMVISTNSQIQERRLLEFTKGPYHGTSFSQETPSFFWTTGPTSSDGNYGLGFLCPQSLDFNLGGDFNLKSLSGSIIIKSGPLIPNFYRINKFINGLYSSSSSNGNLNITARLGLSSILFKSKNINIASSASNISTSTILDIQTTGTTGSEPSLNLVTPNPDAGNLYYKMDEIYPSTRSGSTLFKATNSTTNILEISGKGDFKVDKIMYPIQTRYNPGYIGYSAFGISTRYRIFTPTVALNGQTSSNSFNVSVGMDFYVDVPFNPASYTPPFDKNAICLWTPATGGAPGENGGWLNLLEESEYLNFRIHSTNANTGFSVIAINTSEDKNLVPTSLSSSEADSLSGEASSIEFTIINLSKTAGSTGGVNRWFKVLYQAWGNDLTTPVCGELYTNGSTP